MESEVKLVGGGRHSDERGLLDYFNEFDMSEVKRMYRITHPKIDIKRGWRAHQLEQRWFYVVKGSFEVGVVKIDDFNKPDPDLEVECFRLTDQKTEILYVPKGHATLFRSLEEHSSLMVYADSAITEAAKDNYLYPIDYFKNIK